MGRLGDSVRHHAQPLASDPEPPIFLSPNPRRRRAASHPEVHYHIFSFYILFRTALVLIAVLFFLDSYPAASTPPSLVRVPCFSLHGSRAGNSVSSHSHFIVEQGLRSLAWFPSEDFLSTPPISCFVSFDRVSQRPTNSEVTSSSF